MKKRITAKSFLMGTQQRKKPTNGNITEKKIRIQIEWWYDVLVRFETFSLSNIKIHSTSVFQMITFKTVESLVLLIKY